MGMKYLKHLAAVSLMTSLLLGCGGGSSSGVESGTGASDSNYDPFDAIFSGYKGYREIDGPTQFYRLEGITPICVNPDRVTRQRQSQYQQELFHQMNSSIRDKGSSNINTLEGSGN